MSFRPCSDLATKEIRWVFANEQGKNGSFPAQYQAQSFPKSAALISAIWAETHADEALAKIPTFG